MTQGFDARGEAMRRMWEVLVGLLALVALPFAYAVARIRFLWLTRGIRKQ
jgi:hypothetical protein